MCSQGTAEKQLLLAYAVISDQIFENKNAHKIVMI